MKDFEDIKACYPTDWLRTLPTGCDSITTWNDVQRCLTGRFTSFDGSNTTTTTAAATTAPEPIRVVHILGERHSGTKFITRELQNCFPKSSKRIKVHRDFVVSKHFFQPIRRLQESYRQSLVVVIVRNPAEWMEAMRAFPYSAPDHLHIDPVTGNTTPLPWKEFVSRPWTMNVTTPEERQPNAKGNCAQLFEPDQVVPCTYSERIKNSLPVDKWRGLLPFYELRRDGSGQPFDHLLQLRAAKHVHWILQLPMLMKIGGFLVVRYEDLLTRGTQFLVDQVASITGYHEIGDGKCQPSPPQPERIGKRSVPADFRQWINENVDVETERLLGY
jgi:hypothetical protein